MPKSKRSRSEAPEDGEAEKRMRAPDMIPFLEDLPDELTFVTSEQREGMSFIKGANGKDYTRQFSLKSKPINLFRIMEPMKGGSNKHSLHFVAPNDGDLHKAITNITEQCESDFATKNLTYDEFITPLKALPDGNVQVNMKCDPKTAEIKEVKHLSDGKITEVNCSIQTLGKFQWQVVGLCAPDLTWRMTMEDGLVKAGWTLKARRLFVTKMLDDDGNPVKSESKKGTYGSLL